MEEIQVKIKPIMNYHEEEIAMDNIAISILIFIFLLGLIIVQFVRKFLKNN